MNQKSSETKGLFSVGFIVPDIINPFYAALTDELEKLCHTFGMQLIIGYSRDNFEKEKQIIENFRQSGVNALILSSAGKEELPYPYEIPVVYIDRQLTEHKHHFVSTNHTEGALTLFEEFTRNYDGSIAFAGACENLDSSIQRLNAFKDHLNNNNGTFREELTFHGLSHSIETGKTAYHYFKDLLLENSHETDEEENIPLQLKEKLRFFFTSYPLLEGFVTEMQKHSSSFIEMPLGCFDCPHSFELFPYPLICMRQDIENIATEVLICLKSKETSNTRLITPKLLLK